MNANYKQISGTMNSGLHIPRALFDTTYLPITYCLLTIISLSAVLAGAQFPLQAPLSSLITSLRKVARKSVGTSFSAS